MIYDFYAIYDTNAQRTVLIDADLHNQEVKKFHDMIEKLSEKYGDSIKNLMLIRIARFNSRTCEFIDTEKETIIDKRKGSENCV